MENMNVDLKKEQEATLSRRRLEYGSVAKILFWSLDLIYGKETTLPKVRLLEILARIPYQAWETRQYTKLTTRYGNEGLVTESKDIIRWGREAQDNEFWHLRTIEDRMKQLNIRENWFWTYFASRVAAFKYSLFSKGLAFFNIRAAFHLNAQFEDHAEHTYMQYVKDNPSLDQEKVTSSIAQETRTFESWGDVFRRIALDERDHMNDSLKHLGMNDQVAPYFGS
ncbi:MAG: hypothetical protein V2A34_11490 [Lentisphaerota bacterium]